MINVFYNDYIYVETPVPSKKKLLELKKIWMNNDRINLIKNKIIQKEELYICHDHQYVENIFNQKIPNGFRNYSLELANMDLSQCSSMYESSLDCLTNKISCSLTAGFHHSHYKNTGPYCTFNGVLYSIVRLKNEGRVNKVGIVDLDFHQGDGTDDIIRRLNLSYIKHIDSARYGNANIFKFFLDLKKDLDSLKDYDLIIYLAGMDMYINDPKGGLLEKEELIQRDEIVFNWAKNNNIPITWTLAGGYTSLEEVTNLHNNTMNIALNIFK